jgi:hypothetical protein
MEGIEKLEAVVREQIGKVEGTLKSHVSDEVAKKYTETETALKDIRTELAKRALAGESPKAEDVKDLEKRVMEAEKNIQDFVLRANQAMLGGEKSEEARDAELFKGHFIKDIGQLKTRIRAMRDINDTSVRAIDSDLFTTGGKLSAETADRFIDWVIQKTAALSRITTRRMMSPQGQIDRLTVSTRALRKGAEGVEPTPADAIGTKRRTLTTQEVIWPEDITLTFLEDNIEKRGAEAHIARMLATQFGNDLNDLGWNGVSHESSGADNFIEINDGFFELFDNDSEVHAPSVSGETTVSAMLQTMLHNMPVEYLGLTDLGYFMPVRTCQKYANEVSARLTSLGDAVLINGLPALRYFGLPVVPEPHLYLTNLDRGCLTPFSNLYHGIQRQITVDSEWKPRKRVVEYTITARNDYEYSTGDAVVAVDAIPSGLR